MFMKSILSFDEVQCPFFDSLQPQNVAIMFLFSMKHSYLLTAKIGPNVDNFLLFFKAVQEQLDYLHVKHNFCYLIMASTKLI